MAQSASELIYNWRCYPSSKCYEIDENVQFGIWRSAAAPSDTAEKNCNIGTQLQSLVHKSPKDILENLLPV